MGRGVQLTVSPRLTQVSSRTNAARPRALSGPQRRVAGRTVREGAGPAAPAARSVRSRTPGASSRRRDPTPAGGGGNVGHPQPLPPPARRAAETHTHGNVASGSQARGQTGNLARRSPFVPGPPAPRKRQLSGERGDWLPEPLSSSHLGRGGERVSFSSN